MTNPINLHRVLLLASFFSGAMTFASTIVLDCTTTNIPTLTNVASVASSAVTCPDFNSTLGTLTQYRVLTGAGNAMTSLPTGSISILNPTSNFVNGGAGVLLQWQLTLFTGFVAQPFGDDLLAAFTLFPNSQLTLNFPVGGQMSATSGPQTTGIPSLIGNGTFHAGDVTVSTRLDPLAPAQLLSYTVSDQVSGFSVVYTYDAVPEPESWALVAGGAIMLQLLRRRTLFERKT